MRSFCLTRSCALRLRVQPARLPFMNSRTRVSSVASPQAWPFPTSDPRMCRARTARMTLLYVAACVLTQLGATASAQAPVLGEDTPHQIWQSLGPSSLIESDSFLREPTLVAGPRAV